MDKASLKKTSSSIRLRNLLLVAQTLTLLLAGTTITQGQTSMRDRVLKIEQVERDRDLHQKPLLAKKEDDPARQAVLRQIREDFKNIQAVNNTMMANAWAREELDYGYISDSISQIKSKATRLRSNLALPKAKDGDEKDGEEKQLNVAPAGVKEFRAALLLLDKSIMSFVTNPLFQNANVVEVKLAAKASHDLKVIIELSGNLQKSAATQKKNTP